MRALIIGEATDGPEYEVFLPRNRQDLLDTFGGVYYQTFSISPSGSALVTDFDIFDKISDKVLTRGTNQLYRPRISGPTVTFGPLGGLNDLTVTTMYRPYLGLADLLTSAEYMYEVSGEWPYVCRVRGEVASLTIDDWTFKAKYSGEQYNDVLISIQAGILTVSGFAKYDPCQYDLSNVELAVERLNNDYELNICPVYISRHNGIAPSDTSSNLAGGTTGTISSSSISTALESLAIPPEVSVVALLSPFDSELAQAVETYHDSYRPLFFFSGSTSRDFSTLGTASGSVDWYRHNMLGCVEGELDVEINGVVKRRYGSEGIVAAMVRDQKLQVTNIPIQATGFYPEFDEEELEYLYSIGLMGIVRKIRNGVSIYKEVTTAQEKDLAQSLIYSEVFSRTTPYLSTFMGKYLPNGSQPIIASTVQSLVSNIDIFDVRNVQVTVYDNLHQIPSNLNQIGNNTYYGAGLFVEINGLIFDEILNIKFTVKTRL